MTTAALQALNPEQVDAVLAHQRAHLAITTTRLLAIARIGRESCSLPPADAGGGHADHPGWLRSTPTTPHSTPQHRAAGHRSGRPGRGRRSTPGLAAAATDACSGSSGLLRPWLSH